MGLLRDNTLKPVDANVVIIGLASAAALFLGWFAWGTRSKAKRIHLDARTVPVKSDARSATSGHSDARKSAEASDARGDAPIKIDADV